VLFVKVRYGWIARPRILKVWNSRKVWMCACLFLCSATAKCR